MKTFFCLLAAAACVFAAEPPAPNLELSNGVLRAKFHLPDPVKGYYQGTRFDWAGVIASLERKGHNYFGVWFDRYDPKLHDAITGPVDSFNAIGYDEAPVGGKFLRIGVGWLKKADTAPMNNFRTYDIVDGGKWSVKNGKDWVEFTHTLPDTYVYTKRMKLEKDKLVIDYALKNTGAKALETDVFNHDFFMIDNTPTGPDMVVKLPFDATPGPDWRGPGKLENKQLTYPAELPKGPSVSGTIKGHGDTAKDHDFRVENRKTGVGVRQVGSKPIARLYFWSIRTTVCPEAYVHLRVDPGKQDRWRNAFEFY